MFNELLNNNKLKIVDIGASGGIDKKWENIKQLLTPILFEPDNDEYERLLHSSSDNYIIINKALSDKKENIPFYVCKRQQCSSVYKPNRELLDNFPGSERFDIIKTLQIESSTLDYELEEYKISDVDYIKIDTQGHELSILKGGRKTLENVVGLEIEIEFLEMYSGQPLFNEVNEFLLELDFQLMDIKKQNYWKQKGGRGYENDRGQLVFVDALYLKSPKSICNSKGITEEKIVRAAILYFQHGFIRLMEQLINMAKNSGILSIKTYIIFDILLDSLKVNQDYGNHINFIDNISKKVYYVNEITKKENRDVYAFGVGGFLDFCNKFFMYHNLDIVRYVDSDEKKNNKIVNQKQVINKTTLLQGSTMNRGNKPYIIITSSYSSEIEVDLERMGFKKYIDYISML